MKKIFYIFISFVPLTTFAALGGARALLQEIHSLLGLVVPILLALSMIYFFWGIGQFILKDAGNDQTRESGKKKMIWGIVALFVFLSIYGILNFIGDMIGIRPGTPVQVQLPGTSVPSEVLPTPLPQGGFCPSGYCDDNNGSCYPC